MKRSHKLVAAALAAMLGLGALTANGDEQIMNRPRQSGIYRYAPGNIIVLPDGGRTRIIGLFPDGTYQTENGLIITPEGKLPDGGKVVLDPSAKLDPDTGIIVTPDGRIYVPTTPYEGVGAQSGPDIFVPSTNGTLPSGPGEILPLANGTMPGGPDVVVSLANGTVPSGPDVVVPQQNGALQPMKPELSPLKPVVPEQGQNPDTAQAKNFGQPLATPGTMVVVPGKQGQAQGPTQIWEMLPMTQIPSQAATEKKPEAREPQQQAQLREKPIKPLKQEKPKTPEKPQTRNARPGEQMRIPPEAAQNGSTAFLEGCWQGTRPEYYSKRTIKECFCFGPGGRTGKRRVIDPQGHRRCIGATRADLTAGSGVLHLYSQGAFCDDGEKWGRAEMTCRGTGQSTPCTWVFRDAQGGTQSYSIPLIRVDSCGR